MTFSASLVDEDEGLLVVDCGGAETLALPSALLDEPACGDFDVAVLLDKDRDLLECIVEIVSLFLRDERVLEEAAGIAEDVWVWELRVSDRKDSLSDVGERRIRLLKFWGGLQSAVVEVEFTLLIELESNVGYHHLVFQFVFEDAVTVAEVALVGIDRERLAGADIEAFDTLDSRSGFLTEGADILNRGCADSSWDAREVLYTIKTLVDRHIDEVIPDDAGADAEDNVVVVIENLLYQVYTNSNHTAIIDIGEEEEVASSAYDDSVVWGRAGGEGLRFVIVVDRSEFCR